MAPPPQLPIDDRTRESLINEHLDYVKKIAVQIKKSLSPQLELDELVAYGHRGLVEAAERFDPGRSVAFTTFSYYRIRGAIFDGLRELGWLKRGEYARFSASANSYLENQANRQQPTPGQGSIDSTVQDLAETLNDLTTIFITNMAELDPADPDMLNGAQALENKETGQAVQRALTKLPEKERQIVELHYFQDMSLAEAGKRMGLSKSWSSRLHARAVRLLSQQLGHLAA